MKAFNLRMTDEMHARFRERCKSAGCSMSGALLAVMAAAISGELSLARVYNVAVNGRVPAVPARPEKAVKDAA